MFPGLPELTSAHFKAIIQPLSINITVTIDCSLLFIPRLSPRDGVSGLYVHGFNVEVTLD